MTTAIAKLAERFALGNASEATEILKATAFKGPATDAQMTALCVVAQHIKVAANDCWEWTGAKSRGYGQLTHQGKHTTAHRFVFGMFREPIKDGAWVLHHCDNRSCVNPDHLYQGSPADNRQDMLKRGRWSHKWASRIACSVGHLYGTANFRIARDGSRVCRTCQREAMRKYRAKQLTTNGAE